MEVTILAIPECPGAALLTGRLAAAPGSMAAAPPVGELRRVLREASAGAR